MRFDYLREPVSDDQPAGPDLEEEMDRDYMNYTLVAGGRMPARFFDESQQPFDSSTIELETEMEAIEGLLHTSRDARLLVLAGQFQALAGHIDGFCDVVAGIHILCTEYWDTFYPRESDGDFVVRQNVLETLDDQVHVVLPLQYAPIAGGGRLQRVTLRAYLVATGKAQPRDGEESASQGALANTLAHENTKEQLLELHAKVTSAITQFEEIGKAFLAHDAGMNLPSFEKVADVLKQIAEVIAANRPELAVVQASEADEADGEDGIVSAGGAPELKGKVKTHGEAKAALGAVERYMLNMEPSNPALILIHQARMLFGRPLVEALDALMPDSARRAVFRFDAGLSFEIDISRMRSVSEHAMSDDNDIAVDLPAAIPLGGASSGSAAAAAVDPNVRLDAWGQPIQAVAQTGPRLDAWGQPIVEDAAPTVRLDAWGQPIQEDAAPAPRLDAWGQPIVEAASSGPRLDAWGQPIIDEPVAEAAPEAPVEELAPEPEAAAAPPPVAEEKPAAPVPARPPPKPPEVVFTVTTRGQASELIQAVEGFFRQAEPSSSLPILLSKARGYLNRDFASILSELIPRLPDGS